VQEGAGRDRKGEEGTLVCPNNILLSGGGYSLHSEDI